MIPLHSSQEVLHCIARLIVQCCDSQLRRHAIQHKLRPAEGQSCC